MVDLLLGVRTAPLLHGGRSARPPHLAHVPRSSPLRRRSGLMACCVSGVSNVCVLWHSMAQACIQGSVQR